MFVGGLATVLGHCLSLPGLKGGKGVATSLGVLLTIDPLLALGSVGVFVVFFLSTKIVSLASLACAVMLPIIGFYILSPMVPGHLVMLALISMVVAFRHRSNIGRLLKGEESRFSTGRG
jgi:glycerol-3-phosphate acyltransferase PlsY